MSDCICGTGHHQRPFCMCNVHLLIDQALLQAENEPMSFVQHVFTAFQRILCMQDTSQMRAYPSARASHADNRPPMAALERLPNALGDPTQAPPSFRKGLHEQASSAQLPSAPHAETATTSNTGSHIPGVDRPLHVFRRPHASPDSSGLENG